MMKMNKRFLLAIAVSFPLSVGACATSNTSPLNTGERISQRGGDIGQYGDAWSKGQKDVAQGTKSIEKSIKSLANGEKERAGCAGREADQRRSSGQSKR
jgi:hypothetical protein